MFANAMNLPAFATGGQQGVIAEDRRPRRAGAKEGTPSSRKSLSLFFNYIGGHPLPEILYPCLLLVFAGTPHSKRSFIFINDQFLRLFPIPAVLTYFYSLTLAP